MTHKEICLIGSGALFSHGYHLGLVAAASLFCLGCYALRSVLINEVTENSMLMMSVIYWIFAIFQWWPSTYMNWFVILKITTEVVLLFFLVYDYGLELKVLKWIA